MSTDCNSECVSVGSYTLGGDAINGLVIAIALCKGPMAFLGYLESLGHSLILSHAQSRCRQHPTEPRRSQKYLT